MKPNAQKRFNLLKCLHPNLSTIKPHYKVNGNNFMVI